MKLNLTREERLKRREPVFKSKQEFTDFLALNWAGNMRKTEEKANVNPGLLYRTARRFGVPTQFLNPKKKKNNERSV